MIINPWLGIGLVLAILGGFIGGLRWYQEKYAPHPELVRKLLHIGMGLTTLALPWLFTATWPVLLLAGLAICGLLALRHIPVLQQRLGGVIGGVNRAESLGEIYFPLGVAGLFILAGDDPLGYGIAILLLALADAGAALVGARYGRWRYTRAAGAKSLEGSAAFFLVAFFSALLPLLFFGEAGRVETWLIALSLGLGIMLVEAVAGWGLDNLAIPVVGFLLLTHLLDLTIAGLVIRLALTLAVLVLSLGWLQWIRSGRAGKPWLRFELTKFNLYRIILSRSKIL